MYPKKTSFLVKKPLVYQVPADQGEISTVLTFANAVGRVCQTMVTEITYVHPPKQQSCLQ